MLNAAVHNDMGRALEPETNPGPLLRMLPRRRGLVVAVLVSHPRSSSPSIRSATSSAVSRSTDSGRDSNIRKGNTEIGTTRPITVSSGPRWSASQWRILAAGTPSPVRERCLELAELSEREAA